MSELMTVHDDQFATCSLEKLEGFQNIAEVVSKQNRTRRLKRTPKSDIKERQGKKGQTWKYIDRITAMRWLDEYFVNWSMEVLPETIKEFAGYVYIAVRVKGIDKNSGEVRTITCIGCDESIITKEGDLALVQYIKAAETDALKRCVFTLGGFSDVYTETKPADDIDVVNNDLLDYESRVLPINEGLICSGQMKLKNIITQYNAVRDNRITVKKILDNYILKGYISKGII